MAGYHCQYYVTHFFFFGGYRSREFRAKMFFFFFLGGGGGGGGVIEDTLERLFLRGYTTVYSLNRTRHTQPVPVRSGEAARARSSTPTFTLKRTRLPIQGVDKPRVDREKLHTPLAFSVYMLLLYALRWVRIVALKEKTAQEFKKASSLRLKKRVPLLNLVP